MVMQGNNSASNNFVNSLGTNNVGMMGNNSQNGINSGNGMMSNFPPTGDASHNTYGPN